MVVKYYNNKISDNITQEAKIIFSIFQDQVRLVGGSTRDLLLNLKAKDDDFASTLSPLQIIKALKLNNIKTIETHQKYGTITAVINDKNIEITTLRIDNNQKGRACEVNFIDDYSLDASRRDFSVNAIYLDHRGFFYDYFQGIKDLKNHKIRFIGDPNLRIKEDYLRILRFFRFSCNYANVFDEDGLKACLANKLGLRGLSIERIRKELLLILSSNNYEKVIEVMKIIKKEKILLQIIDGNLTINLLENFFNNRQYFGDFILNLDLKIALIFSDIIQDDIKKFDEFFKKLKISNRQLNYFVTIRNFISLFHKDNLIRDFRILESKEKQIQDVEIILKKLFYYVVFYKKIFLIDALILFVLINKFSLNYLPKIISKIDNFRYPTFPLTGDDLMPLNFKGKQISIALDIAKKHWFENSFKFSKTQLINYLKNVKI